MPYDPPYDHVDRLDDFQWGTNVADEIRIRNTFGYFFGYQNTEFYDMPLGELSRYYVYINDNWREHFVSSHLSAATPICLDYHSSEVSERADVLEGFISLVDFV